MAKSAISITLEADLVKQIDLLAAEADRPRSWLLSQAVVSYLQDQEDLVEALTRANDAKDKTISSAQLRTSLGL